MPWRPSWGTDRRLDPRLDPYRERGGTLADDTGATVGLVYVQVERWSVQVGGHLWWRRWSEQSEALHGYVEFTDGREPSFTDFVDFDGLDEIVADWATRRFFLYASVYRVSWLDDEGSDRMRRDLQLEPEET